MSQRGDRALGRESLFANYRNTEVANILTAEKTGGKEETNREKLKRLSSENLAGRLEVSNLKIERLEKQLSDLKKALRDKERINNQLEVDLRKARSFSTRQLL